MGVDIDHTSLTVMRPAGSQIRESLLHISHGFLVTLVDLVHELGVPSSVVLM